MAGSEFFPEVSKQGPALKNRLVGDAERLVDREHLIAPDGVKYFKDTLSPQFVTELRVFSSGHFYRFLRAKKKNLEMVEWIGRSTLLLKRLKNAWMDRLPLSAMSHEQGDTQYRADVSRENDERQRRGEEALIYSEATKDQRHGTEITNHERSFPLTDNLTTLMFIVASDLSNIQRERLANTLSL